MVEGFRISSELEEMEFDAIHAYISNSYWAMDIPKATLELAMQNSICFGVFDSLRAQVGFARVVTDYATYGYLADVYILEEFRCKGLSKWLLSMVMSHPKLQGLRRITLATQDAHGLYENFGFKPLALRSLPSLAGQPYRPPAAGSVRSGSGKTYEASKDVDFHSHYG